MKTKTLAVLALAVGCGGDAFTVGVPAGDGQAVDAPSSAPTGTDGPAVVDPPPGDDAAPAERDGGPHPLERRDAQASGDAGTSTPDSGGMSEPDGSSPPPVGADGGCVDSPTVPGGGLTFIGVGTLGGMTVSDTVPTPKACRCASTYTCACLMVDATYCSAAGKGIASCAVGGDGTLTLTCAP